MHQVRLSWLFSLVLVACSNASTSTNPNTPDLGPTTGGIAGVATLNGMATGDSGIVVGVLGGPAAYTDDAGNWAVGNLPPGTVTLQATHDGYLPAMATVTVVAGTVTMAPPLDLAPMPTAPMGAVGGHVFLFDGAAANGSTVTLSPGNATTTSAADGSWSIANLPAGVYSATFAHSGYVAQTVESIVVPESGKITLADVTLRRSTTIVNGHQIVELGASPDHSLQLLAIDHSLEVVTESTGAAVTVGAGTAAQHGGIAADNEHLWLSDGNGLLWVGTTDGRSLSLLSATFNGTLFLSSDGSHLLFQATDAQGQTSYYVAATSGGTPTLVTTAAKVSAVDYGPSSSGGIRGAAFYSTTTLDPNGSVIADGTFVDLTSGTVTTVANVAVNARLNLLSFTPSYVVFTTSLGTQPSTATSIGDLYLWKPGAAPAKLSGGTSPLADGSVPVDVQYFPNFAGQQQLVWTNVSNFDADNTRMLVVIDANAVAVRKIVGHTRLIGPFAGGSQFGAPLPPPINTAAKAIAVDMHDDAGAYSFDVVAIDCVAGTVTMVQPNAARQSNGPPAVTDTTFQYARALSMPSGVDLHHFLIGNTRSSPNGGAYMNWTYYDGTLHNLNDPASPISSDTVFQFSSDFRVGIYATPYGPLNPSATPLTIINLPAPGSAGDAVPVPLSAAYYPPNGPLGSALSADHSTVAFFVVASGPTSTLYKVSTAASTTPVTPTQLLAADPNAGGAFTWVGLSGDGALVFSGDQAATGANAWVVTSDGTATPLDANGFGNVPPKVLALADGTRTFVSDETNGGNFLVEVDAAATPTPMRIDNYVRGSIRINLPATRVFWLSSTGPALEWATSTATGAVAGTWALTTFGIIPGLPPDPTMYFRNGNVFTAFDTGTGVVPLATNKLVSSIQHSPDGKVTVLVDQDAAGVNHLIVSPTTAPARLVLADGYPGTGLPGIAQAPIADTFWSPDFSTLYAWGDANAGTGSPPSWTLRAFVPGSAALGTVGTGLVHDATATFGATKKQLFFQGAADPLLGTAAYYASAVGTTAAVKQADHARSVVRSSSDAAAFVVLLPDGTSHIASATAGAAATTFSGAASTNESLVWSADGNRLFAADVGGTGFATVWAGTAGGSGAIYDTDVLNAVMPDFSGENLLTIALHPTDETFVLDHAVIP